MNATPSPIDDWETPGLRNAVLAVTAANTVFWFWTFYFIGSHISPKSDGFEMVAVVPFGLIFVVGVFLPAMRAIKGRSAFRPWFNLGVALGIAIVATMLNAMLYLQILGEFAQSGR